MNLEHDIAWPSQRRIAHETGLSRSTVVKHLDIMEKAGYLIKRSASHQVITAGGPQQQNEYLINIPEKVVREIYHLQIKGGTADGQRWSDCRQKVVRQTDTNINKNNNRTNNSEKGKKLSTVKTPTTNSWSEWEAWGKKVGIRAKPGEDLGDYVARLKSM